MDSEFGLTPEFEQENRQTLENMYKSACLRFGKYLDNKTKVTNSSQGSVARRKSVNEEVSIYGTDSLFAACESQYISGFSSVVSTLKTLRDMDVHTKNDLLCFDTDYVLQHQWNFTNRN